MGGGLDSIEPSSHAAQEPSVQAPDASQQLYPSRAQARLRAPSRALHCLPRATRLTLRHKYMLHAGVLVDVGQCNGTMENSSERACCACMLTNLLSSQAACSLQYALHLDSAVKPTLLTSRSKSAPRPSALIRLDLSSSKEMAETSAIAPDVPDNAPKGDLFITSKRGEIIHLRCYVPDDPAAIKAVLFFFHGYTGHSSSLPKRTLAKVLCERGIAVIQPDLIGHGYSE
eukprot:19642-Heterococcus_DN1.PRE.3